MRRWFLGSVLLLSLLWSTGCALTQTETARQLEQNELLVSGAVDWPGAIVMPKASVRGMYGLGPGDVSVHAGTGLFTYSAGAGARAYLGETVNLSLQGDVTGYMANLFDPAPDYMAYFFSATPRISLAVPDDRQTGFYAGLQGQFLWHRNRVIDFDNDSLHGRLTDEVHFAQAGALAGLFLGVDHQRPGSAWGLIAELSVMPLHFQTLQSLPVLRLVEQGNTPIQLSVGVYRRRPRTAEQRPLPSPALREHELYNEDGIPLY